MSSYKITYFDAPGRAELLRLLFTLANVEFEDERLTGEQFGALKASGTLPFGSVPTLTIDGQVFPQSNAIARYIAREFNLYGQTNLDALRIDAVAEGLVDLVDKTVMKMFGASDEEKPALIQSAQEDAGPRYLGGIEQLIVGPFVVGDDISYADLYIFGVSGALKDFGLEYPPKVQGVIDRVRERLSDLEKRE